MSVARGRRGLAFAGMATVLALGAASGARAATPQDPFEHTNRGLYGIHAFLDRHLIRPIALAYKAVLPGFAREGVHNVLTNLHGPVVFFNDVLQVRPKKAGQTALRVVVNTTVGIGGLFDPASSAGVPFHDNDFGVTLGRYGIGGGPYLFIPLVGPKTVRDAAGSVVDGLIDPLSWAHYRHKVAIRTAVTLIGGLDERARVDDDLQHVEADATDPYATLRSLYLQQRESLIQPDGALPPLPDIEDPAAPPSNAPQTPAPSATPPPTPVPPTESVAPAPQSAPGDAE